MPATIALTVDDRETRSALFTHLKSDPTFSVQVERMPLGDYLLEGRFLIERKTLPDLAASIKSGRLFSQVLRLASTNKWQPLLLLEGSSHELADSGMRWEAIQGALVMITLHIGIPLLRSRSAAETAKTFRFIARQGRSIARGALARPGKRPRGKRALQCRILQGLPGIGPERAIRLLDHFGSIEAVLQANTDALASVPGIGGSTAERIRWAVREKPAGYVRKENRAKGKKR